MPTIYNGGQTPLEIAAIAARNAILPVNTYNNSAPANEYTATHTRAMSDSTTPVPGKGSGIFLDIDNYAGVGGAYDINGNQNVAIGSGRNSEMGLNSSIWGYGPVGMNLTPYKAPNTAGNVGQVII